MMRPIFLIASLLAASARALSLGGGLRVTSSRGGASITVDLDRHAWLALAVSSDGSMTSAGRGSPAAIVQWEGGSAAARCIRLDGYGMGQMPPIAGCGDTQATRSGSASSATFQLGASGGGGCAANHSAVAFGRCAAGGRALLLVAHGYSDSWSMHERHVTLTLDADGTLAVRDAAATTALVALHVALMCSVLVLSAATVLAARRRRAHAPKWLGRHVCLALWLLGLAVGGALCGVLAVQLTVGGAAHFSTAHSAFGLCTLLMALLQGINGYLRPKPGAPPGTVSPLTPSSTPSTCRKWWSRIHAISGYSIPLLALATASLGVPRIVLRFGVRSDASAASTAHVPTPPTYAASTLDGYDVAYTPPGAPAGLAVHWRLHAGGGSVDVAIRAHRSFGYLALAFSPHGLMNGSDAIVGVLRAAAPSVALHRLAATSLESSIGASLPGASLTLADGVALLRFSRPLSASPPHRLGLSASGATPLLWAVGDGSSAPPAYHSARGSFAVELAATAGAVVGALGADLAATSGATCDEAMALRVMQCYSAAIPGAYYDSATASAAANGFDGAARRYESYQDVSREFRVAWTVDRQAGVASIMLQARTVGWVGFGLMGRGGVGNGMERTDMWVGRVVDGVAEVRDGWSVSIEPPKWDAAELNATDDLFDVSGYEDPVARLTTLEFRRRLETGDSYDHPIVEAGARGMAVVYSFSPLGRDALSHYHGPSRGYSHVPFLPPQPPISTPVLVALLSLAGAVLLAAVVAGAYTCARRYKQALAARLQLHRSKVERVERALLASQRLGFCVCFLPYESLKRAGRLMAHEEAREAHALTVLDTYEDTKAFVAERATIFISHQWLGAREPDPASDHFHAVCDAVEKLCVLEGLDPSAVYLWLDYAAIPQRNAVLKGLSISSISIYASACRYFIAVAPKARHADSGAVCDAMSYQRRGWCRLEQWARLTAGGLTNMFLHDGGGELLPLSKNVCWYRDSIRVFDGDFTVDSDREKLVDTCVGLWHDAIVNSHSSDASHRIFTLIQAHKEQVFPPKYFGDLIQIAEEAALAELCRRRRDGAACVACDDAAPAAPAPATAITPAQLELVASSWQRLLKASSLQCLGVKLFIEIFERAPEMRKMFSFGDVGAEALATSPVLKAHGLKVMTMVGKAVAGLRDPDRLLPVLHTLGRKHHGFGVEPADYETVGDALITTISRVLGPDEWTDELRLAWVAVFALVRSAMQHGAQRRVTRDSLAEELGRPGRAAHGPSKASRRTVAATTSTTRSLRTPTGAVDLAAGYGHGQPRVHA